MQRLSRLLQILGIVAAASYLVVSFSPLPNWLAYLTRPRNDLARSDAIVVLAAGQWQDGSLSTASLRRFTFGTELYRRGLAPKIVLYGQGDAFQSEAKSRAQMAETFGVPREAMLLIEDARTTREEALALAKIDSPPRSILLVTGTQHMPRAKATFARIGFDVHVARVNDMAIDENSPSGRFLLFQRVTTELVARTYYGLAGFL